MDKYILQLLKLHSKIILPDFGAIVISDEDTGELMFNEFLNYNDNKLAELVEQESNMDLQEAQNNVAKFVRELKYHLDKGESYTIYKLGEFYKDKDEYYFSGNINTGVSSRPEEDSISPIAPPKEEVKEEIVKAEEKVQIVKEEEKVEVKEEKVISPLPTPKKKKSKLEAVESDQAKKNIYKEKTEAKSVPSVSTTEDSKEKYVTPPTTDTPKDKEQKEGKKKRPFIGLIILIVIALTVFFAIYLNQDRISNFMGWDKFDDIESPIIEDADNTEEAPSATTEAHDAENDKEELIEEEVLEEESIIEEQEVINNIEPQTSQATSPSGNYHIVVGAFSEESNARGMVEELKSQGFNASVIGQFTSNNLYYVAAGSYSNLSGAQAELSKVTGIKEGAWIFKN